MDTPRLTHVRVNVGDLDRAVEWYGQVLGLVAEGYWPPGASTYAHFQAGPCLFAVMLAEPVPAAGRVNFSVADVDGWWARLSPGADIVEPLFETAYGSRKFTIRDPDGNELGFVQDI